MIPSAAKTSATVASPVQRDKVPRMLRAGTRRIVLYPYGHPRSDGHQKLCSAFMLALGGDVQRVIDGPFLTIDRFVHHVSRIPAIRAGVRPIVVLTRTIPLAMTVLSARQRIEAALPQLRRATWAIFFDAAEDPFFEAAVRKFGDLHGQLPDAPIWVGPGKAQFVILSPEVRHPGLVRQRAEELDAALAAMPPVMPTVRPSGTMPAQQVSSASPHTPLRPPATRSLGEPWPWKR